LKTTALEISITSTHRAEIGLYRTLTATRFFMITIFLSILCFAASAQTQLEGCSTGSYVYPNFSGNYFGDCPIYCATDKPIYNRTNPILIQTFASDDCGLSFGNFSPTTHGRCAVLNATGGGYTEGAGLVYYSSTENTCNVPLDDHLYIIIIGLLLALVLRFSKSPGFVFGYKS